MATKSLETFSGAPDNDIHGRTVDGGGVGLTDGVWDKVENSPGAGTFDIVTMPFLGAQPPEVAINSSSIPDISLPPARIVGDLLGLVVYSTDGTLRSADTPSGWTQEQRSSLAGQLTYYSKVCDGTEADTLTVSFTGAGGAAIHQGAFAFGIRGAVTPYIGQLGTLSSWGSATNLGPIDGLTPDEPGSIVLMFGAKKNDFGGEPSATDFNLAGFSESFNAGAVLFWRLLSGTPTIGSTTIVDPVASAGVGTGFMVEIPMGGSFPTGLVHRGSEQLEDWNHYVVKSIPDIGGATGITDYMDEAEFDIRSAERCTFVALLARHSDTLETGYEFNIVPLEDGTLNIELYHIWDDFYDTLRTLNYADINWRTQKVRIRFCVSGPSTDVNISCYVGHDEASLARVIPDDGTLDPLDIFIHNPASGEEIDGGYPGLCMFDFSPGGTGSGVICTYWRAAEVCDDPYPEEPCESDDGTWPNNPPPVEPDLTGIWVMKNKVYRPVDPGLVIPEYRKVYRATSSELPSVNVYINRAWREIPIYDTDPIPDTPRPPYYDPCEDGDPLPIPDTDPGPPPERLFGGWDMPIPQLGPVFITAINATGPWSTLNLSQAAARSSYIIGGVGSYKKYQSGGVYQRSLMQAWIDSHGSYMPGLMASPWWKGQLSMDDHAARDRWGWPSSWSDDDIIDECSWINGYWKTQYPGITIWMRAREAQFGAHVPDYVDGMIAQFRFWGLGGHTPPTFRDEELGLASSRGHVSLLSYNIENGGLGPSSPYGGSSFTHRVAYEMGTGEVLECLDAYTDAAADIPEFWGIMFWKFSYEVMGRTGMMDVQAIGRNQLYAMGAP